MISLDFETINLSAKHPFGISHSTSTNSQHLVVKLSYGDLVGYGEASPVSYHGESIETAAALLKSWQHRCLFDSMQDPFAIVAICKKMDKFIYGHGSVKAAIEMGLHDLCGKISGQPTYKMLGLSGLKQPITDFTIGIANIDSIERKTAEAIQAGYKILKVKLGSEYDKKIIKAIRKISSDIPLRVDANGAWTVKQAIEMSHFLAEEGVQFIEQPIAKLSSAAEFLLVRQNASLPIFADESVSTVHDLSRLAGAVDGVVVKLAKTGGLFEAIRLITVARAFNMQVMLGCMLETSLGITAAAQIAGLADHLDLDGNLLLANDPFRGAVYDDGWLRLTEAPGLGVTVH